MPSRHPIHIFRAMSGGATGWVLGLFAAGAAVWLASCASDLWRQASLLLRGRRLDIDEAAARLEAGTLDGPVLLKGRLGAVDPVISPGGVLCAFYDAELRRPGRLFPGLFLSQERASASTVILRGRSKEVRVEARKEALHAPRSSRPCQLGPGLAFGLSPVLSEGGMVEDAVSRERVGKLNEPCLVLGRLESDSRGRLVIRRTRDLVPLISAGEIPEDLGQRIAHRASMLAFAAAVSTCVAGALVASF